MRTVWKYFVIAEMDAPGDAVFSLPLGAKVVRFAPQEGNRLHLWAEVETESPPEKVRFRVFGTGHMIPPRWDHVASCEHVPFVWHLYRHTGGSDQ